MLCHLLVLWSIRLRAFAVYYEAVVGGASGSIWARVLIQAFEQGVDSVFSWLISGALEV